MIDEFYFGKTPFRKRLPAKSWPHNGCVIAGFPVRLMVGFSLAEHSDTYAASTSRKQTRTVPERKPITTLVSVVHTARRHDVVCGRSVYHHRYIWPVSNGCEFHTGFRRRRCRSYRFASTLPSGTKRRFFVPIKWRRFAFFRLRHPICVFPLPSLITYCLEFYYFDRKTNRVGGKKEIYIYTTIFRETRIVSFINCTHKDKTDPNGFSHCSPSLYGRGKPHSFCLHTPVACDAVRFVICARCIQWMFPQGVLHHTRRIFTRILFLKNSGYIACILERFTTYYPLFSCSGRLENRIMFIFRYRHTVSLPSFESYDDGGCSKRKHSPFDVRAKTFCERDRL